mmetsp:Transcript_21262/g.46927  ORF Transcript_21262/g.46927 Transcript_21262/m.46927 type:complete len:235 (-) Transcript_21262:1082-1786(-)
MARPTPEKTTANPQHRRCCGSHGPPGDVSRTRSITTPGSSGPIAYPRRFCRLTVQPDARLHMEGFTTLRLTPVKPAMVAWKAVKMTKMAPQTMKARAEAPLSPTGMPSFVISSTSPSTAAPRATPKAEAIRRKDLIRAGPSAKPPHLSIMPGPKATPRAPPPPVLTRKPVITALLLRPQPSTNVRTQRNCTPLVTNIMAERVRDGQMYICVLASSQTCPRCSLSTITVGALTSK